MPAIRTPTYDPARLREILAGTGRSLRDLSRETGIDSAYLCKVRRGDHVPGADRLAAILAACGATWADLDAGPPGRA